MLVKSQVLLGLGAFIAGVVAAPTNTLSAREGLNTNDDCEHGGFAPSFADGVPWNENMDGKYFCATKQKDGIAINGMTVFRSAWSMVGIQLIYEDQTTSDVFGVRSTDTKTFNWGGEGISELWTFRNDKGDSYGGIDGQAAGQSLEFKHGNMKNKNKGTKNDIYSGILLAVRGRANGVTLQTLEFRFMNSKPISVETVSMGIDNLDEAIKQKTGIEQVSLSSFWIDNPNKENATYWYENAATEEFGTTTSKKTEHQWNAKITISEKLTLGVPGVEAVEGGISVENGYTYTKSTTNDVNNKRTDSVTYKITGPIPAGMAARCEAKAWKGDYKGTYTAKNLVTLADGSTFNVTQKGDVEHITWTEGTGSCKTYPRDQAPKGILIQQPDYTEQAPQRGEGSTPYGKNGVLVKDVKH